MVKPLNITSVTPVALCIKELFSRSLHIKFKKSALIYQVQSDIDAAAGATKEHEACGQIFSFDTSKTSHHGLIRIRDKRTRILSETATVQETGEAPPFDAYDWRTIIAFRFPMDLNVEEISGYVPGKGWLTIDLRDRRFWAPAPTDAERIQEFNDLQRRLAQVKYERGEVKKARDNGKKRSFMKGHSSCVGKWNDRHFVYEQNGGETDKLFDAETGEEIKKVKTPQPNKEIALVPHFDLVSVEVKRAESVEDVANLAARFEVLGEIEKHLSKAVREIELGLLEDYMIGLNTDSLEEIDGDTIHYGGETYTVKVGDDASYDYPEGTRERWEAGELEMKTVPTNKQWRATELVEETEIVRIIPQDSPHFSPEELV